MPRHSSDSSQVPALNAPKILRKRQLLVFIAAIAVLGLGYAFSPNLRAAVASLDLGRTGIMLGAGEGNVAAPRVSFTAGMTAFQTCTLGCSATVPASGTAGQSVSFQSTGTPSNCVTGPNFQWSFGNGDTSSAQNPNYVYNTPGTYNWQLTVSASQSGGGGGSNISTVAGGEGEGVNASQVSFFRLTGLARDPLARGIFLAAQRESTNVIYFLNTSASSVTLAGKTFAAGEVRVVAGGGLFFNAENTLGTDLDLANLRSLTVSTDGSLVFFIENSVVRALNVGGSTVTIGGASLGPNNVRTVASSGFGSELNSLAVNPADNSVFAADATPGINRVFRIVPSTGATSIIVGNGANTSKGSPFVPGTADSIPLLQPRGIRFNGTTLVVADTGHGRVINVTPATASGNATLVHQFSTDDGTFLNGLAVASGIAYVINGNHQTVNLATGGVIGGQSFIGCDYKSSPPCGDGGQTGNATFAFVGSGSETQEAATDGDASGIYVVDQSLFSRARVRYINRTGSPVTLAGVTIPGSSIQTIAGKGLDSPFDGGASNAAFLKTPVGVAVDANNNLWSGDTLSANRIRFHNRGASQITLFQGTPSQQIVPAGATVTMNANSGGLGDVIPAIQGNLNEPQGLFATSQGIYVVDSIGGPTLGGIGGVRTSALRFVNTSGVTVTFFPSSAAPVAIPPGYMARVAGCEPLPVTCAENGFCADVQVRWDE
jgi:PKD repeat protein